jgi:sulfatase modifying factor 1
MRKNYFSTALLLTSLFLTFPSQAQKKTNPPCQNLFDSHMIKIEGGSFQMGTKDKNFVVYKDEIKQHEVTINSFEISKYEVTVCQWKVFVKETKSKMPQKPTWEWKENYPINQITWEDAISFCNWLSKKEKLQPAYSKNGPNYICNFSANGYRLPTEAEWEYAAKGGKLARKTKYSGSDNPDEVSWHKTNSNNTPHTVGTKSPNKLGLYDMSGNVWEWCWDWHNKDYYKMKNQNAKNPTGPEMGEKRIVRGGSWDSVTDGLRPENRLSTYPNKTHSFYGFRLVKSIVQ